MVQSRLHGRGWPLVILAGIGVVLTFAVVLPTVELFAMQRADVKRARADMALYRAQIAARPRLQAELAALDRQEAQAAALLRGPSTAIAAANMQSLIKRLIEAHSGQMRSAQLLSASAVEGLEKVEVQYELSLPPGSLAAATFELETGRPFLFLDSIDVRPETIAGDATGAPGNLHVQWTMHGYRRMEIR
jgi:general secretion pathway protein M